MKTSTLIIVLIIATMMFTNPNRSEHAIYLYQCRDDERGMLVLDQNTKYHNYIFFSMGEQAEWRSFGFLGQISASKTKKAMEEEERLENFKRINDEINRQYEE